MNDRTLCYIATLLNREVDGLWNDIERAVKEGQADAHILALVSAYRRACAARNDFRDTCIEEDKR